MQSFICPNCGHSVSFEEGHAPAFCSECGNRISITAAMPQKQAEKTNPPAPVYTRIELIGALISYIACYFYIEQLNCGSGYCWPVLITAAFIIGFTIILNRGRKATVENWIWLGCLCISVICYVFHIGKVWEEYQSALFMHLFAVWWILSRSGLLIESNRGDYLPTNALTGFAIIPFSNFFLRIKTIAGSVVQARQKSGKRRMNWWMIPAIMLCLLLFYAAAQLLGRADAQFGNMLERLVKSLSFEFTDDIGEFFGRLLLSLPVGCWLFGLISGSQRADRDKLERRKNSVASILERIRKLPPVFWEAAIVLFSVLYLAFFILQGSYLFGAFTGKLPEGFIVAEYARQGFFELCKIMAVNAVLIWLTTHLSRGNIAHKRRLKLFCLVLLLESILFAVIAFSKLALYISIYGFTPLRLQSSWLICVLFAGCILWIWNLFTEWRAFRLWMYFSGITLALLMLYGIGS